LSTPEYAALPAEVEEQVAHLKKTRLLYYEDPYTREFDAEVLRSVAIGQGSYAVLDRTAFFPEGGGQPGDRGVVEWEGATFEVLDTRSVGDIVVHVLNRRFEAEGRSVKGLIDWPSRYSNMKHHTAAHIVFSAARSVLKAQDLQYMGFQIGKDRVRLDLNREESMTSDQFREIETQANLTALRQLSIKTSFTTRNEAVEKFRSNLGLTEVTPSGEVRLVEVGDQDVSLCCGTHVKSTIEVVPIKILGRLRLQKGIERLEVAAGEYAYKRFSEASNALSKLADIFNTEDKNIVLRVEQLLREHDKMKDQLRDLRMSMAEAEALRYLSQAEHLGRSRLVVRTLTDIDADTLKRMALKITHSDDDAVTVLGSSDGAGYMVSAAGANLVAKGLDINLIVKAVASEFGCRGGGTKNIAQMGGFIPDQLQELTRKIEETIRREISEKT